MSKFTEKTYDNDSNSNRSLACANEGQFQNFSENVIIFSEIQGVEA